ncbi:DUF4192 domain-containing protein [Streptomyces bambusae]|uniref:DUF4192 domain-containing protein n=1 Tax=Streptomyces bambusae TaxID=1550616 RepID=UPI001CFC9A8B|nr:DUF4192 domain-containing protein [Streptomyces bambusae]MCB5163716.1 DUF4192 domain-containing protein [Streptomyces bambusae]
MTRHNAFTGPVPADQITLRGPGELADALPYVVGFHPDNALVLVSVHGASGRFGGRLRIGIPRDPGEWEDLAAQVAECLVDGSIRCEGRPDGIIVFLCREPGPDETGEQVMDRLQPLAHQVRTACGALDVPVLEAICISGGRHWSYCCPDRRCCPPEGTPLALPGTTVMAAAATFAGIRMRGTQRELEARLAPLRGAAAAAQERALDRASADLLPRMLDGATKEQIAEETIALVGKVLRRLADAPPGDCGPAADDWDDALVEDTEAAALLLGLQDRETRDVAAEWMEGEEAHLALRLWRALARRCVAGYEEHAAAPLSLAGWVAWSTGDEPYARIALSLALRADPGYAFAELLHHACNLQLDPETLRKCLREERRTRERGPVPAPRTRPRPAVSQTGPRTRPKTGAPGSRRSRPDRRPHHRTTGSAE